MTSLHPIQEIIENTNDEIAMWKEMIEKKKNNDGKGEHPPARIHRNYTSVLANKNLKVGQYHILLNKKAEAMESFRESTKLFFEAISITIEISQGEHPDFWRGLSTAIITGDDELMKRVASIITGTDLSIVNMYDLMIAYVQVQCNMILNDTLKTKMYLEQLKQYERKWKKHSDYEGQYNAYHGIFINDKSQFLKGITRMLDIYKNRNAQFKDDPWFLEGTAIFRLAMMRGLDINVKDDIPEKYHKYLPMILFEY